MNDEIAARLREAREKAGFTSASEAARQFGWNENTYRSHENGERGLKPRIADKYAEALGVSVMWLFAGEDPFPGERLLQVIGKINEHGRFVVASEDDEPERANVFSKIRLSFPVPESSYVVTISTERLRPRYNKRDILVFSRDDIFDFRKFPLFDQEGIAWTSEGIGFFGEITHDGDIVSVQCIGRAPIRRRDIERVSIPEFIVRDGRYSGIMIESGD